MVFQNSFRICSSDGSKSKSCKHTANEVLDYAGSSKLEAKINSNCDDDCKKLRGQIAKDFDMIEKNATKLFAKEETKISLAIDALKVLSTVMNKIELHNRLEKNKFLSSLQAFDSLYNNYDAEETEATAAEKDAKFNKFVEQSKLDKVTKQNLKNSAKIATKNPSRFRSAVSTGKFLSQKSNSC